MCIIFYNERGVDYNPQEVANGWTTNSDGVGLMYVDDGRVQVIRGLFSRDETVKLAKDFAGIPNALHLRMGTHGSVCEELCHPFRVTPDDAPMHVWMMHNGVIRDSQLGETPASHESDTSVLARQLTAKAKIYGPDIFLNDEFIQELEAKIGSYNKLVFLRDDGKVTIANPNSWYPDEKTGIWYSNRYSIQPSWRSSYVEDQELKAHGWTSIFDSDDDEDEDDSIDGFEPDESDPVRIYYVDCEDGDVTLAWSGDDPDEGTEYLEDLMELNDTKGHFWLEVTEEEEEE